MTSTADKRTQIIATLFVSYGEAGDEKRIAAYSMALKDLPDDMLMRACHKLLLEKKFLPSVSEIIQACRSLAGALNDGQRERTWAEAWKEIQEQVKKCGLYDKPVWSTPEIATAVKAYGYSDLCNLNRDELQTASAQCRRYYEDACRQKQETAVNDFVLKKISGAQMIGLLPEKRKILQIHKNSGE